MGIKTVLSSAGALIKNQLVSYFVSEFGQINARIISPVIFRTQKPNQTKIDFPQFLCAWIPP